jgi:hypothetical protein
MVLIFRRRLLLMGFFKDDAHETAIAATRISEFLSEVENSSGLMD